MRFVTGTLRPDKGFFQPLEAALLEDPDARREAVHHLDRLADGTAVAMFEISGDPDRIMELFEEHNKAIGHQTTQGDGTVLFHSHFEPTPLVDRLLDLMEAYEFAIDMPMVFTEGGRLRVTLIANDETISEVFGAIPEDIDFDIERTGEYEAGSGRLFSLLTERQREVLDAAVREGYLAVPRECTLAELAATLDVDKSTASTILRRGQARLVEWFLAGPESTGQV